MQYSCGRETGMTKEAKMIFNAPWGFKRIKFTSEMTLNRITYKHGETMIPHVNDTKNGKRIVYLPVLYDALKEAVNEYCSECIHELFQKGTIVSEACYDIVESGCPLKTKDECPPLEWIKILQKVKKGE